MVDSRIKLTDNDKLNYGSYINRYKLIKMQSILLILQYNILVICSYALGIVIENLKFSVESKSVTTFIIDNIKAIDDKEIIIEELVELQRTTNATDYKAKRTTFIDKISKLHINMQNTMISYKQYRDFCIESIQLFTQIESSIQKKDSKSIEGLKSKFMGDLLSSNFIRIKRDNENKIISHDLNILYKNKNIILTCRETYKNIVQYSGECIDIQKQIESVKKNTDVQIKTNLIKLYNQYIILDNAKNTSLDKIKLLIEKEFIIDSNQNDLSKNNQNNLLENLIAQLQNTTTERQVIDIINAEIELNDWLSSYSIHKEKNIANLKIKLDSLKMPSSEEFQKAIEGRSSKLLTFFDYIDKQIITDEENNQKKLEENKRLLDAELAKIKQFHDTNKTKEHLDNGDYQSVIPYNLNEQFILFNMETLKIMSNATPILLSPLPIASEIKKFDSEQYDKLTQHKKDCGLIDSVYDDKGKITNFNETCFSHQ